MKHLFALLLSAMSGAALAQTTGTLNPTPAPAQPSVNEDVPPGGCMPIGLTTSGEIVFPIQCKEFIERARGKAVEQKPAAVEEMPAAKQPEAKQPEAKQEAKQSEGVAPEDSKPANKPVETAPFQKHVEREPRERARRLDRWHAGCRHYRTYDPASGTYGGFDGRLHSCR